MHTALKSTLFAALFAFLQFIAAHDLMAQWYTECSFSENELIADTLNAEAYLMLQKGNTWIYHELDTGFPGDYWLFQVLQDTLIGSDTFYKIEHRRFDRHGHPNHASFIYQAYRDGQLQVYSHGQIRVERNRFEAPFQSCYGEDIDLVHVYGGYERRYSFKENGEANLYQFSAIKTFADRSTSNSFAHGIGWIGSSGEGGLQRNLVYSQIDGQEYGTYPPLATDVGHSPPPATSTQLIVYPNPGRDQLRIQYSLQQTSIVTVQLLDILGRIINEPIKDHQKTAGIYGIVLNISQLAAGVYFVRLLVNDKQQDVRSIVIRS